MNKINIFELKSNQNKKRTNFLINLLGSFQEMQTNHLTSLLVDLTTMMSMQLGMPIPLEFSHKFTEIKLL